VRCTPAAIVTGDHEALISELLHHLDEVACHLAEAEIDVVGTRIGQRAVAIASQIGKNDMVLLRQLCSDLVPAGVVFRIAVNEQKRRAETAVAQPNDSPAGAHIEVLETGEMRGHLGRAPARGVALVVGLVCLRHNAHAVGGIHATAAASASRRFVSTLIVAPCYSFNAIIYSVAIYSIYPADARCDFATIVINECLDMKRNFERHQLAESPFRPN
jgi:hypothetical protein